MAVTPGSALSNMSASILQAQYGGGGAGSANAYAEASYREFDVENPTFRRDLLCARLRINWAELGRRLSGIATTYGQDYVFVHFISSGEMTAFKDEAGLYPSDQLITALRLCL